MAFPIRRRALMRALPAPLVTAWSLWPHAAQAATRDRLRSLETTSGCRIGVAALHTGTGAQVAYRAQERFAFCSTFKVLSVSAILQRSAGEADLLQRPIAIAPADLVAYSPITAKHVGATLPMATLCIAALQYSDNTAANLIIRALGGPAAVTRFARSIGDTVFRLDRWETALNDAVPGDPRDTTTPGAMLRDLYRLALGDALGKPQQAMLINWMRGNAVGGNRIRAALPGWQVADKTGSGDYGTTNDVGLAWQRGAPPVVLVVYVTQSTRKAPWRDDVVAAAARIAVAALG